MNNQKSFLSLDLIIFFSIVISIAIYLLEENWQFSLAAIVGIPLLLLLLQALFEDKKREESLLPIFTSFLCRCGGAYPNILAKECKHEISKYVTIGLTIIFTGILATFSGGYALYKIFHEPYLAITFGALWGLMIINLDRMMVMTIRKTNSILVQIFQATPRIILALIIAIVISKPLEVRLFENKLADKIDDIKLVKMAEAGNKIDKILGKSENELRQKQLQSRLDSLNQVNSSPKDTEYLRLDALRKDAKNKHQKVYARLMPEINELDQQIKEIEQNDYVVVDGKNEPSEVALNKTWSLKRSVKQKGKIINDYWKVRENYKNQFERYKENYQIRITEDVNRTTKGLNNAISESEEIGVSQDSLELVSRRAKTIAYQDNFITLVEALGKLAKEDKMIYWTSLMITLLFIVIEIAPILAKLLSPKGEYDLIVEQKFQERNAVLKEKLAELKYDRALLNLQKQNELKLNATNFETNQNKLEYQSEIDKEFYKQQVQAQRDTVKEILERWKTQSIEEFKLKPEVGLFDIFFTSIKKRLKIKK